MHFDSFEDFQQKIQASYAIGEFEAALELATNAREDFPEHSHLIDYWRIAMSARTGDLQQAIRILEGSLESGFWYGETLLRRSPSFLSLQGLPAFEDLVIRNLRLRQADQEALYPLLILRAEGRCQRGGPPCPLMIALHTNAGTAQDSVEFWRPAAQAGWLVAAPQSTQAMWKGAYVWDDREQAEFQVKKQYDTLLKTYACDPEQVLLAGHSLGAETAAWLAITGTVPCKGFLAVGPAGPLSDDLQAWMPLIDQAGWSGLRGYVIVGEEDESIRSNNIRQWVEMLNAGGIPTELEEVPHAGHDFAPEYESSLLRGIEFLQQG
jgi:predicted esterase